MNQIDIRASDILRSAGRSAGVTTLGGGAGGRSWDECQGDREGSWGHAGLSGVGAVVALIYVRRRLPDGATQKGRALVLWAGTPSLCVVVYRSNHCFGVAGSGRVMNSAQVGQKPRKGSQNAKLPSTLLFRWTLSQDDDPLVTCVGRSLTWHCPLIRIHVDEEMDG